MRWICNNSSLANGTSLKFYGSYHSDGYFFISMENLRGRNLSQFLERCGPLCKNDALFSLEQDMKAVEGNHDIGKFHLDMKPDKLMLAKKTVMAYAAVVTEVDFALEHRVRNGSVINGKNRKETCGTTMDAAPKFTGYKCKPPD